MEDQIGLPTTPEIELTGHHSNSPSTSSYAESTARMGSNMCAPGVEISNASLSFHVRVCFLMRDVTELRQIARHRPDHVMRERCRELESKATALTFSSATWVFSPVRNVAISETEAEHPFRLNTLLVWSWYAISLLSTHYVSF